MKTRIFIFFALVSCFRVFAEEYADCEQNKSNALDFLLRIESASSSISTCANEIAFAANSDQYTIQGQSRNIQSYSSSISFHAGELSTYVSRIQCSSNDTCSVDLGPLATICSNIYDVILSEYSVLTNCSFFLSAISEDIDVIRLVEGDIFNRLDGVTTLIPGGGGYLNVLDSRLLSAVSNFQNDVSFQCTQITNNLVDLSNKISTLNTTVSTIDSTLKSLRTTINNIYFTLTSLNSYIINLYAYVVDIYNQLQLYLPYLQTISQDLKSMYSLLSTNSAVSIDQAYTNMFRYSNLLGFDRFRYYAQGQLRNTQVSLYPLSPYDTLQNLRNATIYDAVAAGFESLLISQGSINNYLYWLQAVAGSNRLAVVDSHIMAISNMVYRLDDYVLSDFSNEIASISYKLSFVTNQVDYTTNLVEITNLLQTNNNHLASIDSKLDVLDYIKILSDTPLADYSGDIDYFDYLTNLYLSGVSSSGASTNWFERMEILLASLVFGDSDGTNDIPQSVEMQGFDTDRVSDTMSDFAFSEDFSTSVDNLSQTSRNFMQVLNGYSSALHAVSAPATVSIGTGGIDGSDTSSFEDMMHGHFQVSFNTGTSDRFTVVVRAVTTMSWVLLTMIFIWHCGFWILQKIQFLYRLMRLLINSIWLKS